jgi:hypothetical protein
MSQKSFGCVGIVDADARQVGIIITDGPPTCAVTWPPESLDIARPRGDDASPKTAQTPTGCRRGPWER